MAAGAIADIGNVGAEPIESVLAVISSFDASGLNGDELAKAVLRTEQLLNAVHALSAALLDVSNGWSVGGRRRIVGGGVDGQGTGSARAGLCSRVRQGAAMKRSRRRCRGARAGCRPSTCGR